MPNDPTLKMVSTSFFILKSLSKKMTSEYFYTMVVVPHDENLAKRIPFFTAPEFVLVGYEGLNEKMRLFWETLSESNKTAIWDHLSVLFLLAKKCMT